MSHRSLLASLLVLVLAGISAAQVPVVLTLENPSAQPGTVDVYMSNTVPVAAFQFTISGATVTGATGGTAAVAGLQVFSGATGVVIGISLTLSTIPPSAGVLLTRLQVVPNGMSPNICMSSVVISDVNAMSIPVNWGPCVAMPSLTAGVAMVGAPLAVTLSSPLQPGLPYICGFSGATSPGIPLPDGRVVSLANDFLLMLSTDPLNTIFLNTNGTLDAAGGATVTALVPPDPSLSGLTVYAGFVTLGPPSAVAGISAPVAITVQ